MNWFVIRHWFIESEGFLIEKDGPEILGRPRLEVSWVNEGVEGYLRVLDV